MILWYHAPLRLSKGNEGCDVNEGKEVRGRVGCFLTITKKFWYANHDCEWFLGHGIYVSIFTLHLHLRRGVVWYL